DASNVGAAHSRAIQTRAKARPRPSAKEDNVEAPVISGIAHDRSQDKITLVGVPDVPGAAARIFAIVAGTDANIDMIVQDVSAEGTGLTNISFTCPDGDSADARAALEAAQGELGFRSLHFNPDIGKLSLVGAGMRSHPGVSAKLFSALSEAGVNIHMISTSEIRISVVVDDSVLDEAVRAVHSAFGLDASTAEAVVYGGTGR
ncbi:ACT domain protein, partial [Actinomyces urogenitalis DSM 15434]